MLVASRFRQVSLVHRCRHLGRKRSARRGQGQTAASEKFSFGFRPMVDRHAQRWKTYRRERVDIRHSVGVPACPRCFLRGIRDHTGTRLGAGGWTRVEDSSWRDGTVAALMHHTGCLFRKRGLFFLSKVSGKVLRRLRPDDEFGNAMKGTVMETWSKCRWSKWWKRN